MTWTDRKLFALGVAVPIAIAFVLAALFASSSYTKVEGRCIVQMESHGFAAAEEVGRVCN